MRIRRVLTIAVILVVGQAQMSLASIINFTGFEVGNSAEVHSTTTSGTGAVTWQTSIKESGDYALDINCPAAADTCAMTMRQFDTGGLNADGTANANNYLTFSIYIATLPATGDEPIAGVLTNSDVFKGELRVNAAGAVSFYPSGTATPTNGDGSSVIAANTFTCIQMYVGSGATGPFSVSVNGDAEISGTGNVSTTGGTRYYFGKRNSRNANAIRYYIDNAIVDNASQPACGQRVVRMDVDGDAASANDIDWTIGAGSGADYLQVDEVPSDASTTYLVSTSVDGDVSAVSLESSTSAGITGTVAAVKAFGFFRRDNTSGATQGTVQLGIKSAATASDGADTVINPGVATNYDARQLIYATDPATSAAWASPSALDSLEVRAVEAETTDKTRVTAMNAHVLFTPGGGPPPPTGSLRGLLLLGLGGGQ